VRTVIDLPEEQIKALDSYRKKERISRAEAVRRAVAAFLPAKPGWGLIFAAIPPSETARVFERKIPLNSGVGVE
jgi:Ribbon-helix-helix protein, copG family